MFWWIAGILTAVALFQAAAFLFQRRDQHFEKSAMAMQAVATTIAIMFAGYWYVYERKGQPQANTRLEVVGLKVAADTVALEARFTISNLGSTLLKVGETDARLQKMNADSLPLAYIQKLNWTAFPDRVGERELYEDGRLRWPTVKWFKGGGTHKIEPGETDLRVVDFVTTCANTAMRIMFEMQRPGSTEVWRDQAIVSLADLCGKRIGSKEILNDRKSE